jgi:prepilin-type N-terminal cleavage/methylation domain-containing protein
MTRLLASERGMTLPEVLVVSLILTVVLGAVLSVFETFDKTTETNQRLNDVQQRVRVSVDAITRELRNLASPTNEEPQAVKRALPNDLMFLSVAGQKPVSSLNTRNTRAVRYCLTEDGTLLRQALTWETALAPPMPDDTSCPGADDWDSQRVMASDVKNTERPVFTYNSGEPTEITEVAVSLFIDTDPGRSPKEIALQSAVFLRNQNRVPTAEFDLQVQGSTMLLNGSASGDPEGRALSFYWYDAARTDNSCGPIPAEVPTAGCLGQGLVFNYTPPALGPRTVYLIVTDPAGLQARSDNETGCVGTQGVDC